MEVLNTEPWLWEWKLLKVLVISGSDRGSAEREAAAGRRLSLVMEL